MSGETILVIEDTPAIGRALRAALEARGYRAVLAITGQQGIVSVTDRVNDQAGNIANVECPNPVVLDMTEPRASVVGISGIMVRPASHDQP